MSLSPIFGIEVTHGFAENFALSSSFTWMRFIESGSAGYKNDNIFYLLIQPRGQWWTGDRFVSWIGLGVGASLTALGVTGIDYKSGAKLRLSSTGWALLVKPSIGFDWLVSRRTSLGLSALANLTDTTIYGTISSSTQSLDIKGGIKRWNIGSEFRFGVLLE